MAPSAIRYAGIAERLASLGHEAADWGNVESAGAGGPDEGDAHARFLPQIRTTCERVARLVVKSLGEGMQPLVLGGDHSVTLGTLGGLAGHHGRPGGGPWGGRHGDVNRPETSPSGNVHGMVLAAAMGVAGPEFGGD